MNPTEIEARVSLLHSCYCKFTGYRLPIVCLCDERRLAWQKFVATNHTMTQLETVLRHLNRTVKEGSHKEGAKGFRNLIVDLNKFDELYAEALAVGRNLKPTPSPKAIAQQQFSPVVASAKTEDTAKPASYWIAKLRAAVDNPESVSR